jgi:hypothetical protein
LQKLLPLNLRYVGLVEPRQRLDLGAERPEEITLTIVSEIQRVFAKSSGESVARNKDIDPQPESREYAFACGSNRM